MEENQDNNKQNITNNKYDSCIEFFFSWSALTDPHCEGVKHREKKTEGTDRSDGVRTVFLSVSMQERPCPFLCSLLSFVQIEKCVKG